MTNNIKFKRIMAYCIDILIISILVTLLSNINFLNPKKDKYNKVLVEYNEYVNELQESLKNETTMDLNLIATTKYTKYMYDLQYYGMSYTIIEIVTILLYFVLFSIFNHNQTIGKSLLRIKIVNKDETDNIPIWKHFIRGALIPIFTNVILYATATSILNFTIMFMLKPNKYFYVNIIITVISCAFCYVDILFMLASKDGTSLHDKITKTKVIEKGKIILNEE